jgi:hypothetical protein
MIEIKVPCEVWSRCVGYFRPVNQWHKGKRAEFEDRKNYKLPYITKEEYEHENHI